MWHTPPNIRCTSPLQIFPFHPFPIISSLLVFSFFSIFSFLRSPTQPPYTIPFFPFFFFVYSQPLDLSFSLLSLRLPSLSLPAHLSQFWNYEYFVSTYTVQILILDKMHGLHFPKSLNMSSKSH
eukprot:TRINITY_DN5511_c1_g1_i1.p1 TRINITY_DN5511_c1_g1~~TRINITY_DN5511_c1_g1_i1.p1  ORF type:complete len:124 (-),score=5.49 TRINITY_DN5511_c1_g1_i1:1053-1424(-)